MIPIPSVIKEKDDYFIFGREVVLTISDDIGDISVLEELWNSFTFTYGALKINKVSSNEKTAIVSLQNENLQKAENIGDYMYYINSTKNGINIEYTNRQSLLYAFYTLMQLIEPDGDKLSIKNCEIYDKPFLSFRAIHICVPPNMKLEYLKKIVKLSAFLKFSHIVIEFWGSLKLDALAELSVKTAFTKDEIKVVAKEGKAMGIDIIPMFNHLGHASLSRVSYGKHIVLDQNPKLQELFEPDGWTWCISNPKTLNMFKSVREELIELFGNCGYFHLGFDEAYSYATCKKCSAQDPLELYVKYLNQILEELVMKNIRGIIWGDTLLSKNEFKRPFYVASSDDEKRTHEIIDRLNKSLIINDWQYYVNDEEPKSTIYFKNKGFDVLLSPYAEYDNIFNLAYYSKNHYGVLGTTWNLLKDKFKILPQTATAAWSGEKYDDHCLLLTNTASILRKLSRGDTDYSEWGFIEECW